ncbi:hypothetical protein FED26_07390, partial [Acinetobacter baumannii]
MQCYSNKTCFNNGIDSDFGSCLTGFSRRHIFWHCFKVRDEAALSLIQMPYNSKTLLTRRIS